MPPKPLPQVSTSVSERQPPTAEAWVHVPAAALLCSKLPSTRSSPDALYGASAAALGGHALAGLGPAGCQLNTTTPAACANFCDRQSCDECHPNDAGYARLAKVVMGALL